MIYCILSILILLLVYVSIYYFTYDDDSATTIAVLVFMVLAGTSIINNFIGISEPIEYQQTECTITGLESLNTEQTKINGAFILGTGTVSSSNNPKIQYVFFANTDYGKQLRTTDTQKIYLKETDKEEPKLINIRQKRVRKLNWIDYLWGNKNEEKIMTDILTGQILIVPTNTIKIEYNVEI